jgi:hypothetical protein
VRLGPRQAAEDAKWLNVTAWQGGGLRVEPLERVATGVYRTTEPVPVHGSWKALLRLHQGRSVAAVPIYLPEDPAIPAAGIPAADRFERGFIADKEILQRERKDDVSTGLFSAAAGVVAAIALCLIVLLGWALARLSRLADGRPPGPIRRERVAAPHPVPTGRSA